MADGGINEFEPLPAEKPSSPKLAVTSQGPFAFQCTQADGTPETITATF